MQVIETKTEPRVQEKSLIEKHAPVAAGQFTSASSAAFSKGVQTTLDALNTASTHSTKNLEAAVASATAASKGAGALGAQMMAYSKVALANHVTALNNLAAAKSPQEAVELQTAFAKGALETYAAELSKWSETVSETVKDTMKPLSDRVSASVERLQASR